MLRTPDGRFTSKDGETFLSVTERTTGTDVPVNGERATEINNEFFEGRVLFLHVPQYVDTKADRNDFRYHSMFAGKAIRWEIQLQGRFKKAYFTSNCAYDPKAQPPGGPTSLFLGFELERAQKWGVVAMSISRVMAGMLRALNASSQYRLSLSHGTATERPHIVYPLPYIPTKVLWTPVGESPPPLGSKELQNTDTMKNEDMMLSAGLTYTFVFDSMYVDILQWQIKIPSLRDMPLTKFLGDLGPHFVLYDGFKDPNARQKNPHELSSRRCLLDLHFEKIPVSQARPPSYLYARDDHWNAITSCFMTAGVLSSRSGWKSAGRSAMVGGFLLAFIEGVTMAMR